MDILDCKICYLRYNETSRRPRSLHCGHTYCELCIQRSIKDAVLHCPTCRSTHHIKASTALPVNFDLAELLGQMNVSEEPSSPNISDGSCAGMCPTHPTSALYFYCSTHNTNVCRECTVLEHLPEKCKLKSLAEELRHKKRSNILLVDTQMNGLMESIGKLENDTQAKDELIKALQQGQDVAREKIHQSIEKHKTLLEAREKLINTFNIDEVNTISKDVVKNIGETIQLLVSKGPENEAYAILENKGKTYSAKITLENRKLHLHTLGDTSPPHFAFTLPYTAIREELINDAALVLSRSQMG
ncbi:unnamed protein product [Meganyctiphanes norvegica]|uniref:Uncharacterized protein n=1 Tax=Meganyctiphanes norvegica TaxID=48144 RepID=A0AAV2R173_MEGNR